MAKFDAVIIGTGQAGPALADRLTRSGMTVAIAERGRFGGTCVNTGCIPTKTLIASAHAMHTARRGAELGFDGIGEARVDMKRVKARMQEVSGRSRNGVQGWLEGMPNCTIFRGHARFTGPQSVAVEGATLESQRIFINVGGRASVSGVSGIDRVRYLTNSSMMDVDFLPQRLVIVGGSYIGLEFAQMYRRFGAEVTVIEMSPRLVPREDEDVSEAIAGFLAREGIGLRTAAMCIGVKGDDKTITVGLSCEAGEPVASGTHLLLAIGRRPNTDDLGLDKAGVAVDARGYITVDDELRTSAPGVWALGDCNGRGAFTHTAYNDYEIVADNLLNNAGRRVTDRIRAYCLYTDPPLGRAGMSEAEARQAGKRILVAKRPMSRVGRAVEKGETEGFMKVVVDAENKRILGASLLGTGCDEVVHCILDLMYSGASYETLQRAMHIHPTVSELLPTMMEELRAG
jgi:pyruvate/2-oxoglutarate dehydrogenase complex dihydrolipoamide dehydrogenase (E3) component